MKKTSYKPLNSLDVLGTIEKLTILDQVQRPRQSKTNQRESKKSNNNNDEEENEAINLCETQKSTLQIVKLGNHLLALFLED